MARKFEGYYGQAQQKGWLVYRMDQTFLAPLIQQGAWGDPMDGLCAGLAARWISLQYDGKDYPFDRATLEYDKVDHQAVFAQQKYGQAYDRLVAQGLSKNYSTWEILSRYFRMTTSSGLRDYFYGPPIAQNWLRVIGKAYGCYGISLVSRKDNTLEPGKSHSIAVRHSHDNRFHLFDANFGHFVARYKEGFEELLDWYVKMSNYNSMFDYYQTVIGIRPPR